MISAIRIDPSGNYVNAAAVTESALVPEARTDSLGAYVHGEQAPVTPWKTIYLREGINKAATVTVHGNTTGDDYTIVVGYPSLVAADKECSIAYEYGIIFFCNGVSAVDETFDITYTPIGTVVDTHPQLDSIRIGNASCEAWGQYSEANGLASKAYGSSACARGAGATAAGLGSTAEGAASTGFAPQACTVSAGGTVTIAGIDATGEFLKGHGVLIFSIDGTPLSATATIGTTPVFAANTTFDLTAPLSYGAVTSGFVVDITYGQYGHAEGGTETRAIGQYSHAGGYDTRAVGENSLAQGNGGQSLGAQSFSAGYRNEALGENSVAMGRSNKSYNSESFCFGHSCSSAGGNSIAEGQETSTGYAARGCTLTLVAGTTYTVTIVGVDATAEFTAGDTVILVHRTGVYVDEGNGGTITAPVYAAFNTTFNVTFPALTVWKNVTPATCYVVGISKGAYAHAEGYQTKAIGSESHAEGYQTKAIGSKSHAEGNGSLALGAASHAENSGAACGDDSHAEGGGISFNEKSHAEGSDTLAGGFASHVEGDGCQTCFAADSATVVGGTAVTIAGDVRTHFAAGDTVFVYNMTGGTAYMAPKQDVVNGGVSYVMGNTIFNLTTGIGTNTACNILDLDFGSFAHAEGSDTIALGNSSHSGGKTSGGGVPTVASGEASFAHGLGCGSSGLGSVAMGDGSEAIGAKSVALSTGGAAYGADTFVAGNTCTAAGQGGHAEGMDCHAGHDERICTSSAGVSPYTITIAGVDATAEFANADTALFIHRTSGVVDETVTGTIGALAFGGVNTTFTFTTASTIRNVSPASCAVVDISKGYAAHAEGYGAYALGVKSHAEGSGTTASGAAAHAEGTSVASGDYSHSEGNGSTASGSASHAEGQDTLASGGPSHAEGEASKATSYCSHAEGYQTVAGTEQGHAEGYQSSTKYLSSHAFSSGIFADLGDSQGERIHVKGVTTDAATPVVLLCGGAAITIPEKSCFRFSAYFSVVVDAAGADNGKAASYIAHGMVKRAIGGVAVLVFGGGALVAEANEPPVTSLTVAVTGNDLQFVALGKAATRILWTGTVHFTESVWQLAA